MASTAAFAESRGDGGRSRARRDASRPDGRPRLTASELARIAGSRRRPQAGIWRA